MTLRPRLATGLPCFSCVRGSEVHCRARRYGHVVRPNNGPSVPIRAPCRSHFVRVTNGSSAGGDGRRGPKMGHPALLATVGPEHDLK